MSVAAAGTFIPNQDEQRGQPPSPLWQPHYNFSAERTSAALSNMAPFDFLPTITDPSIDVAASFDASLGWGLGDTELDLVGMFDLGTEPGPSASAPAQGVASGYETPSIDWLRLLGSAREPSTSSAAAAAATAATAGATADGRADVPSVSSTAAGASVGSTGAQVPPPYVHPAVPPARTPRSDPLAGISPQTALSTAEELSLATPSDGGGPEAPSITPWPHVYQPVAPVGPLSLPTVPNPPPPLVFEQPGATVTSQIREAMIELVRNSHISPWSGISLASFPSASVLSICLKLYLSRFHATFPILDPAALESASSSPLLLLSCAAVGAMYRADFEGLGVALTELVRRTTLWMREQDPRSSFELEVVQAWLLSSVSGLFCGSRKLYQHAEIARCGLVTAARRMELLRETPTCVEELLGRKLPSHLELAAAQREDELRLRLGWGIYHFDNLVASLLNLQPVISIAEVAESTYLPSETFMPDPTNRPRFRATIGTLLTKGSIDSPLTPFSTVVLQLTLYRLCIDAAYLDTVLAAAVPPARSGTYRLPFSPDVKHNPQELLDRIGSAWHASSVNVSSLHVVATALSYHAALQFSCGDFLSMAKICAGKYGAERARRARDWVQDKAVKDPVAVRRVLVRAVQLNALLVRHRFDTPAETIWLADSAMAVWAIIKFAGAILTEGPEALSNPTAIKWNDVVASEPWIQRGGPLSLRSGLGEYGTATPGQVLRKFSEHLEDLPWGLSRKYRAVLLQLSQEEDLQEM
ncbi:fungal specific transcription factor domain-containing protein [Rhodotorula paludigena]|uniref:fungal specific transcription factor domain-containing protein n=1 Tax=Rhodotorula paludigena TaxID=86838 RepID=UPI0031759FE4